MTRFSVAALSLALVLLPTVVQGQASQFGTRGLGLPSLPLSARSHGAAGGFALFDRESAVNPAALTFVLRPLAAFAVMQSWRTSESRFGEAAGNDSQFPLFLAAGPMGERMAGSLSASVYTDRTFSVGLADTLLLGGVPVIASDTLRSRGGVTDLRAALAYRVGTRAAIGVGLHLLTGTNRIEFRRWFSDTLYTQVLLRNELSFSGVGISLGLLAEPVERLQVAAFARLDGDLGIDRDDQDAGSIPLPRTVGAGVQWQAHRRLLLAGHVLAQTWSRSDQELRDRMGTGAENTVQGALGLEWSRSRDAPGRFPIRLGVRRAQLPFPASDGAEAGSEFAAVVGTGFRFGGERGSLDVALERVWRRDGDARERAFALKVGVGIRP